MSSLSIEDILGGAKLLGAHVKSGMDLFEVGRRGVPKKALLNLAARINISLKVIAGLVHVTERTIQRKKDGDLLSEPVSEHVLQLAEVFARGDEVFRSEEDLKLWLDTPHRGFGGKKPMELLSSRFGAQMVLDELGRIEHGVLA